MTDAGEVFTRDLAGGEVRPLPVLEPKKTCTHGQEEKGRKVRVRAVVAGTDHILFLSAQDEIWVQGCGPALGETADFVISFIGCDLLGRLHFLSLIQTFLACKNFIF